MELSKKEIEHYREGHIGDVIAEELCAMALAHLAASERSVQGWALLTLREDGAICQPVTITINAEMDKP